MRASTRRGLGRLSEEIAAWRLAHEIREYVAALRLRLEDLEEADRDRLSAWFDWAEQWGRRTDPIANVSRVVELDDEHHRFAYPHALSRGH